MSSFFYYLARFPEFGIVCLAVSASCDTTEHIAKGRNPVVLFVAESHPYNLLLD